MVKENYQLCLCDFGFARPLDKMIMGGIGTHGYMAPEMYNAVSLHKGVSVDIFSLGVVLFGMAFGQPFLVEQGRTENIDYHNFIHYDTRTFF